MHCNGVADLNRTKPPVAAAGAGACRLQRTTASRHWVRWNTTHHAAGARGGEASSEIDVREGQRVRAGQSLLQLEATRTQSHWRAAGAGAQRRRAARRTASRPPQRRPSPRRARNSPRRRRPATRAAYYRRVQPLGRASWSPPPKSIAPAPQPTAPSAGARGRRQRLLELEHGTRSEQIAQGEAAARGGQGSGHAQAGHARTSSSWSAPRAGVVDSLPYRLGRPGPVGARWR
jgi:HlyD family secretion protein